MKNFFITIFQYLREILKPPQAFSWQTLIWLSVFSGIMSGLATDIVQQILAFCGWIFLILGVSWATTAELPFMGGIAVGAWLTGALICIFIFGIWSNEIPPIAYILWFPISAVLASVRHFFDGNLKIIEPDSDSKQKIIILIGCNLLIACWIQFYFVIESWSNQYPTITTDEITQSAFVQRFDQPSAMIPRGGLILNIMEKPVRDELTNKNWSQVEKWLLKYNDNLNKIHAQVNKNLSIIEEDKWWKFKYQLVSAIYGYKLTLSAIWTGPRSQTGEYYIEKACQIIQVNQKKPKTRKKVKKPPETDNKKLQIKKKEPPKDDNIKPEPPPIQVAQVKCEPLGKLWFEWYKK